MNVIALCLIRRPNDGVGSQSFELFIENVHKEE